MASKVVTATMAATATTVVMGTMVAMVTMVAMATMAVMDTTVAEMATTRAAKQNHLFPRQCLRSSTPEHPPSGHTVLVSIDDLLNPRLLTLAEQHFHPSPEFGLASMSHAVAVLA